MKLVDVAQMRELERIAIEDYKIPSLLLMENAATGFLHALQQEVGSIANRKIHVVCGKGNNGGDGLAIARMAHNIGAEVFVTLLFDEKEATGDVKTNLEIIKQMQLPFVPIENVSCCDIIVEAIFGTGFHGEPTGTARTAIDLINQSSAYVASVDIPGGVQADTGYAANVSVYADLCVTFSLAKLGHFLYPGGAHYKKLIKTDISIPRQVINDYDSGYDVIDNTKRALIPARDNNSHKGSYGKALAFVGSEGMSGAAILSACAILKSGAGMVTAAIPETIANICASYCPSVMTYPLPTKNGILQKNTADILLEKLKTQDVLLMGCGLGCSKIVKDAVLQLLEETQKPVVLDADGINLLAQSPKTLKNKKCNLILTPHVAEFARLTQKSISDIKENAIALARSFATEHKVTLVLKDAVTIVADEAGRISLTPGGNSGMATAGSGDVLAGIITGLLAQGATPHNAAVCGVHLHAVAGAIAREKHGEYGMTSEEILRYVPNAFTTDIDNLAKIKEL